MTIELTDKQKSFFAVMRSSPEYSARGIAVLLERKDFANFFDNASDEGVFDPDTVPRPESDDGGKTYRLLYWPPLDYLMACAKWARDHDAPSLAQGVMRVVRAVTRAAESDAGRRDNYHVWRTFAEIIGILPLDVLERSDVSLIRVWLQSRFDHDGVVHELDKGVFGPLLESGQDEFIALALGILELCLRFEWREEQFGEFSSQTAVPFVDAYWLQELVGHQSELLGRYAGGATAVLFSQKLVELFAENLRAKWSCLFRAAIEEHAQNQEWRPVENVFISGLRDVVLSWANVAPNEALPFVRELMLSDSQILRRIGIFILNERWGVMRSLYMEFASPALFELSHLHELYGLLRARFPLFSDIEKDATIRAIDELPLPPTADPQDDLAHSKIRWLSALSDCDFRPASERLRSLLAEGRREIPHHADFLTYSESGWGHGPSPFAVDTLLAFAEEGSLVERIGEFREQDSWHGPSLDGLLDALDQAIASAPDLFARVLSTFKDASPVFQSRAIDAFKRLWESQPVPEIRPEWEARWDKLLAFVELLLIQSSFDGDRDGKNTSQVVVSSAADLLQAGSRDDERAYPPTLRPRVWAIIVGLLGSAEAAEQFNREAMSQAINSPRGRVIEAAMFYALQGCRIQENAEKRHVDAWASVEPLFNHELESARGRNFEFSTLAGAYFANLLYMSSEWTTANCARIFSPEFPDNFACAVDGLAYSQDNRPVYVLLRDAHVIDRAIRLTDLTDTARKQLNERIALGYLWGEDSLESERTSYWFRAEGAKDIQEVSWFLWSGRNQNLSSEQRDLVRAFLERGSRWLERNNSAPREVASSLGLLVWSLPDARGRHEEILRTLVPGIAGGHSSHEFVAELNRLVEGSPVEVVKVFGNLLDHRVPFHDYDDELKKLIENLARVGQIDAAIRFCNRLRGLPGMPQLYDRLKANEL